MRPKAIPSALGQMSRAPNTMRSSAALLAVVLLTPLIRLAAEVLGPSLLSLPTVVLAFLVGSLNQTVGMCWRAWRWSLPILGLAIAVVSGASALLVVPRIRPTRFLS